MRFRWPKILLTLIALQMIACTHAAPTPDNTIKPSDVDEYRGVIQRHTVKTNQYSGFYQTFQADMTILSSEVQIASLRQKGGFMQWDEKQFQAERDKIVQDNSAYSHFFMRFYTPEHDYDDLHK